MARPCRVAPPARRWRHQPHCLTWPFCCSIIPSPTLPIRPAGRRSTAEFRFYPTIHSVFLERFMNKRLALLAMLASGTFLSATASAERDLRSFNPAMSVILDGLYYHDSV